MKGVNFTITMLKCPFNQGPCNNQCALYAEGINKCTFVGMAMLLEDIQKISVAMYEKTMRETVTEQDMSEINKEIPKKS